MIQTIGVIGNGVVGNATARCFMEWAEVRVCDAIKERSPHTFEDVLECDLIFVCLPEKVVSDFFWSLPGDERCWVIKSTVPVGTTRKLAETFPNVVHSPEFLTARCAVTDAQLPARNIIGTPNGRPNVCDGALQELYRRRFPGTPLLLMSSDESEVVKLIVNSFFAVKVAFFNEVNAYCTQVGMNWDRVLGGVLSDGRIAHSHTKVPGPDGQYGFGGACLPKDLKQLIELMYESKGEWLFPSVCRAAMERNGVDRQRVE